MRPPGACVVFTAVLAVAVASPLCAATLQDQDLWENKTIKDPIETVGLVRQPRAQVLDIAGLKPGMQLTKERKDLAIKELFKTNRFEDVDIRTKLDPTNNNQVIVTIVVREYVLVEKVEFKGINEIPIATLKPMLRLAAGEPLNPFHLKQDRETIREQYLLKGYHFSSVEESIKPGSSGVILTWNVVEGPLVSIDRIVFTGEITADLGKLQRFI